MLKKQYRLKNNSAFTATYKLRNTISDDYICVYFGKEKTDSEKTTKFGFVVSKKIHKRAVIRNRIKRYMRENIRLIIKNNDIKDINKYISIIFVAKTQAIYANYSDIENSLKTLLIKKSQ